MSLNTVLIVMVSLMGIILVSSLLGSSAESKKTKETVQFCIQEAARSVQMSLSQKNPVFQMKHANEAAIYANIAQRLTTEEHIKNHFGTDCQDLREEARSAQNQSMAAMAKACPNTVPTGHLSLASGWAGDVKSEKN